MDFSSLHFGKSHYWSSLHEEIIGWGYRASSVLLCSRIHLCCLSAACHCSANMNVTDCFVVPPDPWCMDFVMIIVPPRMCVRLGSALWMSCHDSSTALKGRKEETSDWVSVYFSPDLWFFSRQTRIKTLILRCSHNLWPLKVHSVVRKSKDDL